MDEEYAVPKPPLPQKVIDFLLQPNPSVITAVRPDGQPVSVATWYLWEDGRVLVNMDESRRRLQYLRNDPRVSLTVLGIPDWYVHVSLQGRVVEIKDDPGLVDIDRLAVHYTGQPYRVRDRARVSAWIEVDYWHGWASGRPMDAD